MSDHYDKLRQELDDTKHVNNPGERDRIMSKVSATALIDIAETLSQLLQVGMVESAIVTLDNLDTDDEPVPTERPLEVGDVVRYALADAGGFADEAMVIAEIAVSEGQPVALLKVGPDIRYKLWLADLERVEPFDDPDPAKLENDDGHADADADAYAALVAARKGGDRA
jgi:hypothetical protein